MRGQLERTDPLFSFISTEYWIPVSHPLRQVRRLADQALDRLNSTFCQPYPRADSKSQKVSCCVCRIDIASSAVMACVRRQSV